MKICICVNYLQSVCLFLHINWCVNENSIISNESCLIHDYFNINYTEFRFLNAIFLCSNLKLHFENYLIMYLLILQMCSCPTGILQHQNCATCCVNFTPFISQSIKSVHLKKQSYCNLLLSNFVHTFVIMKFFAVLP